MATWEVLEEAPEHILDRLAQKAEKKFKKKNYHAYVLCMLFINLTRQARASTLMIFEFLCMVCILIFSIFNSEAISDLGHIDIGVQGSPVVEPVDDTAYGGFTLISMVTFDELYWDKFNFMNKFQFPRGQMDGVVTDIDTIRYNTINMDLCNLARYYSRLSYSDRDKLDTMFTEYRSAERLAFNDAIHKIFDEMMEDEEEDKDYDLLLSSGSLDELISEYDNSGKRTQMMFLKYLINFRRDDIEPFINRMMISKEEKDGLVVCMKGDLFQLTQLVRSASSHDVKRTIEAIRTLRSDINEQELKMLEEEGKVTDENVDIAEVDDPNRFVSMIMDLLDTATEHPLPDKIMVNIERIILLITNLVQAQTHAARATIVMTYLHSLTDRSIMVSCLKIVKSLLKKESDDLRLLEGQSFGDILDKTSRIVDSTDSAFHSNVIRSFRKIVTVCVCAPIMMEADIPFDPEKTDFFEKDYIVAAKTGNFRFDLILDGIKSVRDFCTAGYKVFSGEKIEDVLLHSGNAYSAWYAEFSELQAKQFLTTEGSSDENFINIDEFNERVLLLRKKGVSMVEMLKKHKDPAYSRVDQYLSEVKNMVDNIDLRKRTFSTKKMPFAVYIYGPSGVGKTSTAMAVYSLYGSVMKKPVGQGYLYTRNKDSEYDDGYLPTMWAELNDEIGSFKNAKDDPSMRDHFKRINTTGFLTKQAALEKKDAIPYNVELYIGTGNQAFANFKSMFNNPSAALRRFNVFVEVSLKPGIENMGGIMDQQYTVSFIKYLKDINVDEAKRNSMCEFQPYEFEGKLMQAVDWPTFERFMRVRIVEFDTSQNIFLSSTREYMSSKMCQCGYMSFACQCTEGQGQGSIDGYESDDTIVDPDEDEVNVRSSGYVKLFGSYLQVREPEIRARHFSLWWKDFRLSVQQYAAQKKIDMMKWMLEDHVGSDIATYALRKRVKEIEKTRKNLNSPDFFEIGQRINGYVANRTGVPHFLPLLGGALGLVLSGIAVAGLVRAVRNYGQFGTKPTKEILPKKRTFQRFKFPAPLPAGSVQPFDQFVSRVERNTARIIICDKRGNIKSFTNALCIRGDIFLIAAHGVPNEMWVRVQYGQSVSRLKLHHVPTHNICKLPNEDLCLVRVVGMPSGRNIKTCLVTNDFPIKSDGRPIGFEGTMISRDKNGVKRFIDIKAVGENNYTYHFQGSDYKADGFSTTLSGCSTYAGMCGSPVIVDTTRGPLLLGVHVAGRDTRGFVRPVSLELLDKFILEFNLPELPPFTGMVAQGIEFNEIHPKSTVFEVDGDYRVFGDIETRYIPPRHSVVDSNIRQHLSILGEEWLTDHTVPVMRHVKERKDLNPYSYSMKQWVNVATDWDHNVEEKCNDAIINYYLTNLTGLLSKVKPYDTRTALAGANSVYGVEAMDSKTSTGYPFNTRKEKVGIKRTDDDGQWLDFSPECQKMYDDFIEKLEKGESCYPIFKASLKDEPVSLKKHNMGKTRVFSSGQWAWNVLVRQLFLSVDKCLKENFLVSKTLAGVNPESSDWARVFYSLKHHGDKACCGDWEFYDKSIGAVEIMWAGKVLISLMRASGNYTDQELQWSWILIYDIAFPVTLVKTTLVQFKGSNPSGNPLTTLINILVNLRRMISAYVSLVPGASPDEYFDDIGCCFLGDDNLQVTNDETIKYFNCVTLQKYFQRYGLVYTSSDKGEVSKPYCSLEEMDILKRRFRYDEELDVIFAPRHIKSLAKSLNVRTKSTISAADHAIDVIISVNREMVHYGRQEFNEIHDKLLLLIKAADISYFDVHPLANFDQVWVDFMPAYDKIPLEGQMPVIDGEIEFDRLEQFTEIDSFYWKYSGGVEQNFFYPWYKYFDNALIKPLISQSAYISCALELKFVYTTNTRMSGLLIFAHEPCFNKRQLSIDTNNASFSMVSSMMQASMLDHIMINPSTTADKKKIMTIENCSTSPWFTPHSAKSLMDLGVIHICEMASLQRLAEEIGNSVRITVYARAVNLKQQIPTGLPNGFDLSSMIRPPQHLFFPFKGKDKEVTKGGIPIEQLEEFSVYKSDAVELLKKGIGQSGVSDFLSQKPIGIVKPMQKPKPSSLSVKEIAQKYTFFFSATWVPRYSSGDRLCAIGVTPWTCVVNKGKRIKVSPSHCSSMARLFSYWRGTMTYKFVFVTSPMVVGRISINWTPFFIQNMRRTETSFGPISKSFDLADGNEIEFSVPYAGRTSYLECRPDWVVGPMSGVYEVDGRNLMYEHFSMNGVINVMVEDALQSPLDTPVEVLVFAKGGDDIAFMEFNDRFVHDNYGAPSSDRNKSQDRSEVASAPKNKKKLKSLLKKAASFGQTGESDVNDVGDQQFTPDISVAPAYPGVETLYEGLSQYMFHGAVGVIDDKRAQDLSSLGSRIVRYVTPTFPLYRSGHPGTTHKDTNGNKFQSVRNTLVNYVSSMFVGVSGSISWRVKPVVNRGRVRYFAVDKSTVPPNLSDGWYGHEHYAEYSDFDDNTRLSKFCDSNMNSGLNNLVTTTGEEAISSFEIDLVSRYLYRYATRSNPYSNSDDDANSQFLRVNKIIQISVNSVDPLMGVDGDLWWVSGSGLSFHHHLRPLPFWVSNADIARV